MMSFELLCKILPKSTTRGHQVDLIPIIGLGQASNGKTTSKGALACRAQAKIQNPSDYRIQ